MLAQKMMSLKAEHQLEAQDDKGLLPQAVVVPVQIAATVWKAMFVSLVFLVPQTIVWAYIAIDFAYDIVVRLLIGSICKPCAWIFIWAFKLPTFPLVIFGWTVRLMVELMGALVSGWMLVFKGSGCFLRWGKDCRFGKRFKDRKYWQIADLTIWMRNPTALFVKDADLGFVEAVHQFFQVPQIADFETEMAKVIGQNRRQELAGSCPLAGDHFQGIKSLFDF